MTYEAGMSFPAGDGCNECFCDDDGMIGCSAVACPPRQECMSNDECQENELCDFESNNCGASAQVGTCAERPTSCPGVVEGDLCGCDGSYANSLCSLQSLGHDLDALGGCTIPNTQTFVCGGTVCDIGQICELALNDVVGPDEPEFYSSCLDVDCDAANPCDCFDLEEAVTCEQRGEHTYIFYPGG